MDTLKAIKTRRSIRRFKNKEIAPDLLEEIIEAGMYAPSARNEQPWHFLVISDRMLKEKLMKVHPYAGMLDQAPLALLVCGDTELETSKGYWPVDCAASTQNILLAAHTAGLGAVWLGVYPRQERMEAIRNIFCLPSNIEPFALIALGYPDEQKEMPDRFKAGRIHFNKW